MAIQPYEEGGITGKSYKDQLVQALQGVQAPPLQTGNDMPPPFVQPQAPASAPSLSTQYRGQLQGFDAGKLDAQKNDPKYVFAKYAQGLNVQDPNDRAKLQDLLRGDQSGFFKNATLDGDILHGAYDPATGGTGDVDVIKGLKAGGEGWQWGALGGPQAQAAAPSGGGMPSFSGSTISPMLQSDAQANIQQALSGLQQPGLLQQLIAALGGG